MENHPTTTTRGPWRVLILDRDPRDPKWILATVATPGDVRPARRGMTSRDCPRGPGAWGRRPAGPAPRRAHTDDAGARVARR